MSAKKQTTANVKHRGSELTVQHNETDSPIIPVAQLQRLHEFKPEAVDWVIKQTQVEAEFRRSESKRVNTFVFIERIAGQIFSLIIGMSGISGGSYVALHGQPLAGGTIATAAITGLAVVFLTRGKKSGTQD